MVGNSSYTYDENGNVTSDGTRSYKWDAGGRLVEVDDANGTAIAAYSYDSLNRMVQKIANGSTTNYLYDGMSSHVVAEYDGSGKQLNYYTWGPSGLLSITTGGKAYYAIHGRRGDIEALTDATGNVVVTYKYDTWGNLLSYTDDSGVGLAMSNPYRYADYRYDSDVGMYYLMARWYDSGIGRFLSPDPITILPSYTYAGNDPVSFIDPTGYQQVKGTEIGSTGDNSGESDSNIDDEPYNDEWDSMYDDPEIVNDRFSSRDKKKREKEQVDSQFGKRGTPEREKKSGELHEEKRKRGGGNNVNKKYKDLGNYNVITVSQNYTWWEKPAGVGLVIVGGVATIILVADDSTIVGLLDDPAIAVTGGAAIKGLQMVLR